MNRNKILYDEDLDALIEAAPLGIVVFNKDARIVRWNPAAEKIFGWKECEVINKIQNPILPEGYDEEYDKMKDDLLGGGCLKGIDFIRKRRDGKYVNVKAYSSLIKDKNGIITGVVGMYDDITEQKREHEKLVWNELMLRQMTESSRQGYYLTDIRTGNILYCNKKFLQLWGLNTETKISGLSNDSLMELCSHKAKDKEKYLVNFNELKRINNEDIIEDELNLKTGITLKYYTTPLKDMNNNYLGRFFTFEDISERKLYEALLESEDEYIRMVESSPEAILISDNNGIISICNNQASKLLCIKKEIIINNSLQDILNIDKYIDLKKLSPGKSVSFNYTLHTGTDTVKFLELNIRLHPADRIHIIINEKDTPSSSSLSSIASAQSRFVFASIEMKKINFEITRLANLDFDILLEGETGTGKDLIAAQIHQRGNRSSKPFIVVPISTLNESLIESELFGHEKGAFSGADRQKIGKFEAANNGILYIPEISSLPEIIQLKLLHFMQYKTINRVGQDARKGEIKLDVRLIMATNETLEELVNAGKFRKDFYYRISGTKITIPPIRERKVDIEVLAKYFIELYRKKFPGKKFELSGPSLELLYSYSWPGNVRELANTIKNVISFTSGPYIEPRDFGNIFKTENHNPQTTLSCTVLEYQKAEAEFKKIYFKNLLERANYKISDAAKLAGLTPQGLRKALHKLGM